MTDLTAQDQRISTVSTSGDVTTRPAVPLSSSATSAIGIQSSDSTLGASSSTMIDGVEFRSRIPEPTYHTLNGRISPNYQPSNINYASLTPLQPLPPISSVAEKFGHGPVAACVSGTFTFVQNSGLVNGLSMDGNSYRYEKMSNMEANVGPVLAASPMSVMGANGYTQMQNSLGTSYPNYSQTSSLGVPLKQEAKMMSGTLYDSYSFGLSHPTAAIPPAMTHFHSPNSVMQTTLNNLHPVHSIYNNSSLAMHHGQHAMMQDRSPSQVEINGSKHEMEEINTKELAQKISSELKRYSIPQAVFAQRVLCRSQGTLSDLLRNPKPWSKLKSGRETFRRMWKWLQEPEFQRMSALRLAGVLYRLHLNFCIYNK